MIDPKDFKKYSPDIIGWIENYLNQVETLPVKSQAEPGEVYNQLPEQAPQQAESMENIMADLNKIILPGLTHWQHPNFHAYFPANTSVESILAEFLTSAIGAQCMIWDTSPAAAELEQRMMEWLRDAMGLPGDLEGVIQDSASSATLVAILTAREVKTGFSSNENGVPNNLRIYCSTETHSSIEKAVGVSGIGKRNLIKIGVDRQLRMDPAQLEKQIVADIAMGYQPCAVIGTIGTTSTLAVDPIDAVGTLCKKYDLWFHVDAAYAGTALLLPEYAWMIRGIEHVDSFVFNPHKWMFTNFDCSVYFVKDAQVLIKTFEILPEYLKTRSRGRVNDYRDWSVPLGRRFRALKLWFVIRGFGLSGIRERLRTHIKLSEYFSGELMKHPGFELMLERFLNFTCFRFKPDDVKDNDMVNKLNEELLEEINHRGRIFLTHTRIDGNYAIRMVIGQTYVQKRHIEQALSEIISVAGKMQIKS